MKIAITIFCLFLTVLPARADNHGKEVEYKLKAACLFNFAKFVEWPPKSFTGETDALVIVVWGENPFGDMLEQAVAGRLVHQRPVVVRYANEVGDLEGAHLVFVSHAAQQRNAGALKTLAGKSVLTVGEGEGFLQSGGMIQFQIVEKKLRFSIAETVAQQAGLRINAQLMSLALPARGAS